MGWIWIIVGVIVLILFIRWSRTREVNPKRYDIIKEGKKRGSKIGFCCSKIKNLFGGGA